MLTKVRELIDGLEGGGVRYCHVKKETSSPAILTGQTDIDLLISQKDALLFKSILTGLLFKQAVAMDGASCGASEDYYGFDEETGLLVTVHASFRMMEREVRSCLPRDSRCSPFRFWFAGGRKFFAESLRRPGRRRGARTLVSGGAVICFVGPEATGKSTLLDGVGEWLGEHFAVYRIHAGKPPSTLLSAVPNRFLPYLRARFPACRPSRATVKFEEEQRKNSPQKGFPLVSALRSVLLAYDRRSLLKKAVGRAGSGSIVLCDRFPCGLSGAPDGPSLGFLLVSKGRLSICRLLARLEEYLYRDIPNPNLILQLSVPLEVALERNRNRGKEEPEDFVRLRHAQSVAMDFGRIPVYRVNTDRPFPETLLDAKRAVWNSL